MKVSNFDKPSLKAIRMAMNAALKSVEDQYGIKVNVGNASYSANEVTFKVKANTIGDSGEAITKEAQNWSLYAGMNGLGQFKVGDQIELQGKTFTITGWNTRAKKSPVNIQDANGRGYKCSAQMIKMYNS
tara:strand:+ start:3786 stop:4175 length:390 start_codon:yes stop_codon:yes gene_type:complete